MGKKNQKFRVPIGLSADSNHEFRILDFGSFSIRYIYIFWIFRPCGIETKVFHHTQPLRVIHSLSF